MILKISLDKLENTVSSERDIIKLALWYDFIFENNKWYLIAIL